jgi:hypothetical protein
MTPGSIRAAASGVTMETHHRKTTKVKRRKEPVAARRCSAPKNELKPRKRVSNMRIAALIAVVAVTVGFVVLPACAEERPSAHSEITRLN